MSDSPTLVDMRTRIGYKQMVGVEGLADGKVPIWEPSTVDHLLSAFASLSVEEREAAGISEHQWCEEHQHSVIDPNEGTCRAAWNDNPCRMVSVLIWPKEAN